MMLLVTSPFVKRWWAVGVMMVVTFVFGTDLFSSQNTRDIIRWIMQWLLGPGAEAKVTSGGEGLLRKSAHFVEYGILAYLWFRAVRGDHLQRWKWSWFLIALLATTAWAVVDELQQGFISSQRTGNPWDVVLDSAGALTALLLVFILFLFRPVRKQQTNATELVASAPSSSVHQ